jgi:hypothetical protein
MRRAFQQAANDSAFGNIPACSMLNISYRGWSGRGAPEQFYLPREAMQARRTPWEPAFTHRILDPMRQIEKVQRKPAVRQLVSGPNQPCSCGSGRKYKKCCAGLAPSSPPLPQP